MQGEKEKNKGEKKKRHQKKEEQGKKEGKDSEAQQQEHGGYGTADGGHLLLTLGQPYPLSATASLVKVWERKTCKLRSLECWHKSEMQSNGDYGNNKPMTEDDVN